MSATLAGLLGTLIGALAGILGGIISHTLQARSQRKQWLRDKKVEAYSNVLRYLLRFSGKRSIITAEGSTVLGRDAMKEWFDDLAESRYWLSVLGIYCDESERTAISKASEQVGDSAAKFLDGAKVDLIDVVKGVHNDVAASARRDIGVEVAEA